MIEALFGALSMAAGILIDELGNYLVLSTSPCGYRFRGRGIEKPPSSNKLWFRSIALVVAFDLTWEHAL